MKRIISQCSKNLPSVPEVVKLRLRGKGSGFKEGPKQEESKEALHLCIRIFLFVDVLHWKLLILFISR